jgi:anti-sigma-K factor RskA
MTVSPDDDFAAAEYALGTLDPGERAALAARRLREPDLDAAIRAWEARLGPLAEAVAPIEPARDLLSEIEERIRAASSTGAARISDPPVVALRRSLARWRAGALAASFLAAILAIGWGTRETIVGRAPRQYVAVLQKDAASPAFAITVNLGTREFTVRPIAATAPAGKAYELWLIDPRVGAPRSLGVIAGEGPARAANLAQYDRAVVQDATYAVTVEPPGGSPDGKPSGPPVFVGKLIPVGPD